MSDFGPSILQSLQATSPTSKALKCGYHWNKLLKKRLNRKLFIFQRLVPANIPPEFQDYFEIKAFLTKSKTNTYSPQRIVRYDVSILTKLPSKELFDTYMEIISPFWRKYCPKFLKIFKSEYLEEHLNSGWQYYLSESLPKTNNNVEAYNKTLKGSVTKRKAEDFSTYYHLMKQEVADRSKRDESFPYVPTIPKYFYSLGDYVANKFEDLYLELNNCYYIRDKTVNFSFLNKNKTGLIINTKKIVNKLGKNAQADIQFSTYLERPTLNSLNVERINLETL